MKVGKIQALHLAFKPAPNVRMRYFINCLKRYANPMGRASRAEYWNFLLFYIIGSYFFAFIGVLGKLPELSVGYSVFMFLPGLAVGMRRMHDLGKIGGFYLLPGYNLILAARKGTPGPNAYGPAPQRH